MKALVPLLVFDLLCCDALGDIPAVHVDVLALDIRRRQPRSHSLGGRGPASC
jgi:hypothetical protein